MVLLAVNGRVSWAGKRHRLRVASEVVEDPKIGVDGMGDR